ncbi:MAG: DUF4349 domain-containing protein [Candidatus Korobacteraceae bacterium]
MSKRRKVLWAAVAVLLLLFLVAISLPNLRRPRPGPQEAALSSTWASTAATGLHNTRQENIGLVQPNATSDSASAVPDRKLIHNAELGLTVVDVRTAAEQIRRITEAGRGEIDNLEITEGGGGSVSATLVVRVPASGLEIALTEYKKLAVRTDHEQVSGRDVTREFYDNEAHMRNLRAEEQQYLTIMKQAHTVSDTLEVSEKLSDVRDRIERLQAQIQVMTHDIEMSAVGITLSQESDTRVLGIRWRPLYNAKIATRELLVGLGEWTDWVVAVLIRLPLILLWALTVGALLWVVWKIGRAAWPRFLKAKNAGKAQ